MAGYSKPAHLESESCQVGRAGMNLGREVSAEFRSHHSLDVLYDTRNQAPVVVELFSAIGNLDAALPAEKLIMGALVDVLKPSPTTDIEDQDMSEIGITWPGILKQLDETRPVLD